MASYAPVKLAYATYEPTNGADKSLSPIVFLHGSCISKEHWNDIPAVVANATKRKVYAIDARNHGDSEWSDVFNFDVNADDLLNFLDTIKAPKAILIGHSMGGITSIKASLRKPERIERIIVEDMGVQHVNKSMIDKIADLLTALRNVFDKITPEMSEEDAQNIFTKTFITNIPPELVLRGDVETMAEYKIPVRRSPDGRFLPKVNIDAIVKSLRRADELMSNPQGVYNGPATFIYGKISMFVAEDDKPEIRKYFPNADFVAVEEAAHSVHIDRPTEFTNAVLKALL